MIKKLLNNILGSYNHIPYTFSHYIAFLRVEKELLGYYKYKFHDWDKIVMYILFPFLGESLISQIHQRFKKHHPIYTVTIRKNKVKQFKSGNSINWEEAVIDWECARLTKPDKPLNAYETLIKYYPGYIDYAKPTLLNLNLWEK